MYHEKILGIIGLGYWGKNILRNLYEMGVLHTACDTNAKVLSEWEKQYPNVHYTDSFQDILADKAIRAVTIATPATTHYRLVKESLYAGKDVFVEKPLALTVKEGEELVELAKEKKRILMVGHVLQYHPAVIKLKELITSGKLGKIHYIYSNRLNIGKLRTEENILWSFAPHDISVILMLLEEEPVEVMTSGGDYLNRGIFDVTVTTLHFKNGIKGHIFVSWLHPYKEQKLVVVGSKAMAVFDDLSDEKLFIYPHTIEWINGKVPVAQKADYLVVDVETGEPLRLELGHFIDCIKNRKKPKTDGEEGLKVLKILEEAEKSLCRSSFEKSNSAHTASLLEKENEYFQRNWTRSEKVFAHPTVWIDENVEIGEGTKIWHFSHILANSKVGKYCNIGQNVSIGPNVTIGDGCKIQNNVSIYEGVTLEDEVFCGPSCVFTNVVNPRSAIPRMKELKPTLVKKGASLGANCTIICGHNIGQYAFVGAGAIVTKDVPDYALVVGNPARIVAWMCRCGIKLNFVPSEDPKIEKAHCSSCGTSYIKQADIVKESDKEVISV